MKRLIKRELLIEKDDGPNEVSIKKSLIWKNEFGRIHRDGDKPAIIYEDGTKFWYKNGQVHREGDSPAIISANGQRVWYKNNKCHRNNDRPAIIYEDDINKAYFNNGEQYYPKIEGEDNKPIEIYMNSYRVWFKRGEDYIQDRNTYIFI